MYSSSENGGDFGAVALFIDGTPHIIVTSASVLNEMSVFFAMNMLPLIKTLMLSGQLFPGDC